LYPERKIEILEKGLSPKAQKHSADREEKVTTFGVIVRYTKKAIEKKGWGQI